MNTQRATADPSEIREWAELHGLSPAEFTTTDMDSEPRMLDLIGPGPAPGDWFRITWEQFFAMLQNQDLALVYERDRHKRDGPGFYELVNNRLKSQPVPGMMRA